MKLHARESVGELSQPPPVAFKSFQNPENVKLRELEGIDRLSLT